MKYNVHGIHRCKQFILSVYFHQYFKLKLISCTVFKSWNPYQRGNQVIVIMNNYHTYSHPTRYHIRTLSIQLHLGSLATLPISVQCLQEAATALPPGLARPQLCAAEAPADQFLTRPKGCTVMHTHDWWLCLGCYECMEYGLQVHWRGYIYTAPNILIRSYHRLWIGAAPFDAPASETTLASLLCHTRALHCWGVAPTGPIRSRSMG